MVRLRLSLLLGWAALIFIGSSFPNPPGASGGEWRYDLAHMVEYAVLGALAFLVVRSFRPSWPAMVVMVAAWATGRRGPAEALLHSAATLAGRKR